MSRKRLATLLLSSFFAFTLLAAASLTASAKVRLVFAGRDPLDTPGGKAWQAAVEAYMKENRDVEVEYTLAESGHPQFVEKLLVLAASVGFPDVMHLYNVFMPELAAQGALDTIPGDLLKRLEQSLNPQSLVGTEYDGEKLGVPTQFMINGLLYNKRLLAQAGVGSLPRTWDEMAQEAKRLVNTQPAGNRKLAGMSANGGGWGWTATWLAVGRAYGATYATAEGELTLDTPVSRNVLEKIVEWFGTDRWATSDRVAFTRGEGYFGMGFPWWATELGRLVGEDFTEQIGVTKMPAGPAGTGAYHYGWGLYVSRTSLHRDEAWKFIEWLAISPEFNGMTAIGTYQAAIGALPTNRRDLQAGPFAKRGAYYGPFVENIPYAVTEAKLPKGDERQNILAQEIEAAIARKKSPPQALADAAQRLRALLSTLK